MPVTYGRSVASPTVGYPLEVIATPADVHWKTGGVTIDWSTVVAVSSDTTLPDGTVVLNGRKYLRYGQVVSKIKNTSTQTLTSTHTSGNFLLSFQGVAQSTAQLAFNATAANVVTALESIPEIGPGNVTGAGGALGSSPVTISFVGKFIGLAPPLLVLVAGNPALAGGTFTIAYGTAPLTNQGQFGPYDSGASDGRQTITRGEIFVVNETILEVGYTGFNTQPSNHPAVFDGATVFKDRIIMHPTTASLANGPTVANFEAAFPLITYAEG